MNIKSKPVTGESNGTPLRVGEPQRQQRRKKFYGLLGGAALSAAVAFGGTSFIGQVNPTYAQTTETGATATPVTTTTTPTTSPTAMPGTPSGQTTSGTSQAQPPAPPAGGPPDGGPLAGGPAGRGGPGGLGGTISAINGNTITLKQSSVIAIEATVNDNTAYNEAGKSVKLSDLGVGERVNIRTTASSDGTESVAEVNVVLDHAAGTISAIDSGTLTLTHADSTTTSVSLGSGVSVMNLGNTAAVSDLKTGQKVDVAGQLGSDGTLAAQVISLQYDHVGGKVTAISGNTLTIEVGMGPDGKGGPPAPPAPGAATGNTQGNGSSTTPATGSSTASSPAATTPSSSSAVTTTRTITVGDSTAYLSGGQTSKLADIAVGDRIEAQGTASSDGSSFTALQLEVHLPSYHGQVSSVNGSTIVIKDAETSRTITVSDSTKYLNGTASASLGDVKSGVEVRAEGKVDSNGNMTALTVQLGGPAGPPAPGGTK